MNDFFAKLKSKFMNRVESGPEAHPERDWLILLSLSLLFIAASVVWNVWFFDRVANVEPALADGAGALETYPAGAIQELFTKRAEMEAAYRSSFPFIDPSR